MDVFDNDKIENKVGTVDVNGYKIIGWKTANSGYIAAAARNGKGYVLKKYSEFKLPRHDGSVSYERAKQLTNHFYANADRRVRLNRILSELAKKNDDIIAPVDWFVNDICFVEATDFVSQFTLGRDVPNLPAKQVEGIMLSIAKAVRDIHGKGIVHGDIQLSNILAAKDAEGNAVGKLIDFDGSYCVDDMPSELGGDERYMSPELFFAMLTEFAPEAMAMQSTKSDIFSLGIVFHKYLTGGEFPGFADLPEYLAEKQNEGRAVYCCEAMVSENGKIILSDKIKEEYLANLICAMLQPELEDRPTADEVVNVLCEKKVIPLKDGSRVLPASAR